MACGLWGLVNKLLDLSVAFAPFAGRGRNDMLSGSVVVPEYQQEATILLVGRQADASVGRNFAFRSVVLVEPLE